MSAGKRGMGRGLAAILAVSDEPAAEDGDLRQVPVDLIGPNPRQPRRSFDQAALQGLADSISERGVVQPVERRVRIVDERVGAQGRLDGIDLGRVARPVRHAVPPRRRALQ